MIQTDDTDDDDESPSSKPEWKKKKVEDDERLTLRIDAIEADKYQARKNKMQTSAKRAKPQKMGKKVKQMFDEDEDEDDGMDEEVIRSFRELRLNQSDASNSDTSLIDALSPNEKRMIEQRTNIEITRHQENAGRLNAMEQADTLARKAGMQKTSDSQRTEKMQDAIYNPKRIRAESLEKNIAKQIGLKGEIKFHTEGKVVTGVKELNKLTDNHKVKNVKMSDAKDLSKKTLTENEKAELILRKSGQTAKLSEIKKQSAYGLKPKEISKASKTPQKDFELNAPQSQKNKEQEKDKDKSYSQKLKSLLQESLRKNNKVRG